ncbi:MAG: hypothetical protein ABIO99_05070 [Candidatus Limnocylindria bacterium]
MTLRTGSRGDWQLACIDARAKETKPAPRRPTSMQPTARTIARRRPNRVLVALAAAWMILSFAIGAAVKPDSSPDVDAAAAIVGTTQP